MLTRLCPRRLLIIGLTSRIDLTEDEIFGINSISYASLFQREAIVNHPWNRSLTSLGFNVNSGQHLSGLELNGATVCSQELGVKKTAAVQNPSTKSEIQGLFLSLTAPALGHF